MSPSIRLILAAAVMLALAACAPERGGSDTLAAVTAAKKVRVGVKADTPPFGVKGPAGYRGFDIDLAEALAKQLKIDDVELVTITSENRIAKLLAGEVDMVVASMTITRSREQEVDFTIPYFQDGQGLLVKADSPIKSYLDLVGRSVGSTKGSTSGGNMHQVAPDAKLVEFADFAALMAGFEAGQVDAITSDTLILIGLMKNAKEPGKYRLAGDRFTTEPYGIAVQPNQSAWRRALNHGLQELWENGQWQLIHDAWFGPKAKYATKSSFAITPFPR